MYKIDFIGLICFSRRDGKGRIALLPDGREPGPGIDPHIPRLVVRTSTIESVDSGLEQKVVEDATVIFLPKCHLTFDDTDTPDASDITLDTSEHDRHLPRLSDIDPLFEASEPAAVVRTRIRRGVLKAYRYPGTEVDPAVVSQLEVTHDGPITITVEATDTGTTHTIRLKPGTEVVLANAAERVNPANTKSHFVLYERLASQPVDLSDRAPVRAAALRPLQADNPFFEIAGGIGQSGDCTNGGCCP